MNRFRAILVAVALFAMAAHAQPVDRDVLLTSDGTLYTVFSEEAERGRILKLNVQKGDDSETLTVPATLAGSYHNQPALAYEPETGTLFIFWQQLRTRMSSDLLFCSYQSGSWSEATAIDSAHFRDRANLRIGVTRYLDDEQADGSLLRKPATIIHAVWWEQTGYGESARYAMLSVERGKIALADIRDLSSFLGEADRSSPVTASEVNPDFLRHPAVFEQPGGDSVEVLFAESNSGQFHRVEIRPRKGHGYLKPPIGRSRGGIGGPSMKAMSVGRVSVIQGRGDSLVFYFESENRLNYISHTKSGWSALQSITLGQTVTLDMGINALRKLASSE